MTAYEKAIRTTTTLSCSIWGFNWLPSFDVTEQAITGLVTPQARPSASFEGTNT